MKRQYDFSALALRHGFNRRDLEKACARARLNLEKPTPNRKTPRTQFHQDHKRATEFTNTQLKKLTSNEKDMIDQFWSKGIFKPELSNHKSTFHTNIAEYPAVLWTLKKLRKTKPPENSPSSSKSQATKPI